MTAGTGTPVTRGLNSRLAALLGALSDGLAVRREPGGHLHADITFINAVAAEISQPATTAAAALALYAKTFIMLTRLGPGEFTRLLTGDTE